MLRLKNRASAIVAFLRHTQRGRVALSIVVGTVSIVSIVGISTQFNFGLGHNKAGESQAFDTTPTTKAPPAGSTTTTTNATTGTSLTTETTTVSGATSTNRSASGSSPTINVVGSGGTGTPGDGTGETGGTPTTSPTPTTTTPPGSVAIGIGAPGSTNRLTVNASDIAPGDSIERVVDVFNASSSTINTLMLTTTAVVSSQLDQNTTNGLQMTIDECSVAWTEVGPPYSYTCGGTATTRQSSASIIRSNIDLCNAVHFASAAGHYRVRLQLPSSAGSGFQAQSSQIQYTFTAT